MRARAAPHGEAAELGGSISAGSVLGAPPFSYESSCDPVPGVHIPGLSTVKQGLGADEAGLGAPSRYKLVVLAMRTAGTSAADGHVVEVAAYSPQSGECFQAGAAAVGGGSSRPCEQLLSFVARQAPSPGDVPVLCGDGAHALLLPLLGKELLTASLQVPDAWLVMDVGTLSRALKQAGAVEVASQQEQGEQPGGQGAAAERVELLTKRLARLLPAAYAEHGVTGVPALLEGLQRGGGGTAAGCLKSVEDVLAGFFAQLAAAVAPDLDDFAFDL